MTLPRRTDGEMRLLVRDVQLVAVLDEVRVRPLAFELRIARMIVDLAPGREAVVSRDTRQTLAKPNDVYRGHGWSALGAQLPLPPPKILPKNLLIGPGGSGSAAGCASSI